MKRVGLPHSEIPGSKVVCTSPRLIAACHVLRRLLEPRHPPCALCSLTTILSRENSALQNRHFNCQRAEPRAHFGGTIKIRSRAWRVNGARGSQGDTRTALQQRDGSPVRAYAPSL